MCGGTAVARPRCGARPVGQKGSRVRVQMRDTRRAWGGRCRGLASARSGHGEPAARGGWRQLAVTCKVEALGDAAVAMCELHLFSRGGDITSTIGLVSTGVEDDQIEHCRSGGGPPLLGWGSTSRRTYPHLGELALLICSCCSRRCRSWSFGTLGLSTCQFFCVKIEHNLVCCSLIVLR